MRHDSFEVGHDLDKKAFFVVVDVVLICTFTSSTDEVRTIPLRSLHAAPLALTSLEHHGRRQAWARGGGHLPPPPENVQMGICNPSPEFLTVFVVGQA